MRSSVVTIAIIGALVGAPRRAEACHEGFQIMFALFTLEAVVVDGTLTVHDALWFHSSRRYAVIETAVAVPNVAAATAFAVASRGTCDENGPRYPLATSSEKTRAIVLLAWSSLVLGHGVYELVRPRASSRVTSRRGTARWLAVMPVVGEADGIAAGMQLVGTF